MDSEINFFRTNFDEHEKKANEEVKR